MFGSDVDWYLFDVKLYAFGDETELSLIYSIGLRNYEWRDADSQVHQHAYTSLVSVISDSSDYNCDEINNWYDIFVNLFTLTPYQELNTSIEDIHYAYTYPESPPSELPFTAVTMSLNI